ncbi:MAG TPA: ergothioneine biosynthesis protein EgtB [Polyangiaceae bacterium]|nr:ergothioneine biosynthesis protein EgtB [Polyangiaceae bacterium]
MPPPPQRHDAPPASSVVPRQGAIKTPVETPSLLRRYVEVRSFSETLCEPLALEDYVVQTMPEVSPTKWHLAHTTWFFETFVLARALEGYEPFHPAYNYLFNSYYEAAGDRHARDRRGVLSRPTVEEVIEYRYHVNRAMAALLSGSAPPGRLAPLVDVIVLGLHHEQQHQELMLTDLKHVLASNPLRPAYRADAGPPEGAKAPPLVWHERAEGLAAVGAGEGGFSFDNERPRHRVFLESFELASRPVTAGEYLEFIRDGGYDRPELWLSDGWAARKRFDWQAPLYWEREGDLVRQMTLGGLRPLCHAEPVCHISYYEADAFARWYGARLPTECEWEAFAERAPAHEGNYVDAGHLHPEPAKRMSSPGPLQLFGDVWEWTASPYAPYPGFRPLEGALGEYNGKFMCNQMVLRGGSCLTPRGHVRASYRNFFPPEARWQMSGLRLAR